MVSLEVKNKYITRLIVLLSFVLCTLIGEAQVPLWKKINQAIETQDLDLAQKLYDSIISTEILNLPDSTQCDYHVLGGWVNCELEYHEKAISHLLIARKLCETSLGVHSGTYADIMCGLGGEYMDNEQYEDALAIYEEGIVKSMYIRSIYPHIFGKLIMGVVDCYERMGWFNEIPQLFADAWVFWSKEKEPFDYYNYWPLFELFNYYQSYGEYDEAIETCDKILHFITDRVGDKDYEIASMLYFRGSTLSNKELHTDAIEDFKKALLILKHKNMESDSLYEKVLLNLLMATVDADDLKASDEILSEIKDLSEKNYKYDIYKDALYSVAKRLDQKCNYSKSLTILSDLFDLEMNERERDFLEEFNKGVRFRRDAYENSKQLKHEFDTLEQGSKNWFQTGYKLSTANYWMGNFDEWFNCNKQMYDVIRRSNLPRGEYHLSVLSNLCNYSEKREDYKSMLTYATEYYNYISSMPGTNEKDIILSLSLLIVAKIKSQNLYDIDLDLNRCETLCLNSYGEKSDMYATCLHNKGRALQLQGKLNEAKEVLLKSILLQKEISGKVTEKTIKYYEEVEQKLSEI